MIQNNIAAVVIHMQNDFLEEIKEEVGKTMYEAQVNVLKKFAGKNLPIYTVELIPASTEITYQKVVPDLVELCRQSSKYSNVQSEKADAFSFSNIKEQLKTQGVNNLLVMGVWESFCVYQNAKSALKQGFNVLTCEKLMANPAFEKRIKESWFKKNKILLEYTEILTRI